MLLIYFITAAFLTQTISLDDAAAGQCTVKFEIWDTAGQERYRSLAPMYYRGASAAVIVFDITRKDSFAGAKSWVKELQRRGDNDVIIALTGNKCDMESSRKVQTEEAEQYARDSDIIYLETSAKTGHNVHQLFVEIAKKLPKTVAETPRKSEGFNVLPPKKQSKSCC